MTRSKVPTKIFLDTTVVNLIVEYGEVIFENFVLDERIADRLRRDIYSMRNILILGQRMKLDLVISKTTIHEVLQTADVLKRDRLFTYCCDLWDYAEGTISKMPNISKSEYQLIEDYLGVRDFLDIVGNDRHLLIEAMMLNCDHFCTRDWKTILKFRNNFRTISIKVITPFEWWSLIESKI